MKRFRSAAPLVRAIGVMAAVGIIATGVTYAALQSQQAILTGNTIESATAALQVSKDGGNYATTMTGFDFPNLVPGGPAVPITYGGYSVWFKNTGTAPLSLKMSIGSAPIVSGDVDLSKVFVVLTPNGGPGASQSFSLAALQAAYADGGTATSVSLPVSPAGVSYKLQVSMAADAFSGPSATISQLDLVFMGAVAAQ